MLVNFALEDPTSDLIELGFHVFEHSFHNIKQRIPSPFWKLVFAISLSGRTPWRIRQTILKSVKRDVFT